MRKIALTFCWSVFNTICFLLPYQQLKADVNFLGIPEIDYYNRRSYGGATQNWKISQAENGLIYSANNDGILEFDGTEWRLLPKATNVINRSVLAHGGKVYMGAYNEFGYYEYNGVNDFVYQSLSTTPGLAALGDVWNIIPYNDMIVFQADKGLVLYKDKNNVTLVPAKSRIPNAFLVNGLFLVYDEIGGLMELRQGKLFEIPGGEMFAGVSIGTILPLSEREILIGTITQGLYVWDLRTFKPWISPASEYLKSANIFCGTTYNNNGFVFGTIQNGVVVTDFKGNIRLVAAKDKGLHNNTVLGIEIDKEGNIWVGLDNGIARIGYNSTVSFLQGYYDLGTGYAFEIHNNTAFLGTNQGLYQINMEHFSSPIKNRNDFYRIPGTSGQVWSLFIDKDKQLLCGHNSGVLAIEGKTSRLITPPYVVGAWIFRYPPDRNDILLVGTYNGVLLLKKENGNWVYKKRFSGFEESSRFMEWDFDGGLWITHGYRGVFKLIFNKDYDEIARVQTFKNARGIEDDKNLTVSNVNGSIVFSSYKGIFGYDLATESFYRHEWNSFFYQDEVYPVYLVGDRLNNIWFFANGEAGVLRRLEDGTYTKVVNSFYPLKGQFVNGFEFVKPLDTRNAIFGVEDGFAHYTINDSKDFQTAFKGHIRNLRNLNDDLLYFFSDQPKNQLNIPSFPYSSSSFEVAFSATSFESSYLRYSNYLEGFDTDWQPWGNAQKRQFTKLHEGIYTIWVKAVNIHGVETESVGFSFEVRPPWFRTQLAKVFYVVIIIALFLGAWYLLNWLIERSKSIELHKQQENFRITEEQLKNKALESEKEMIRLRNEKLRTDMLYKEKELANSTMHIIQKNEFLQKIKEDLTKLLKVRDIDGLDKKVYSLVQRIDKDIDNDSHWKVFEVHLEQVHEDFLERLRNKHPDLSSKEMKLCAYLRMEMSSKEISSLMNISVRAVENNRYKLRKKLNLDGKDNLIDYIMVL